MAPIIVNRPDSSKFADACGPVDVCNADGQILSTFLPTKTGKKLNLDPGISTEEMRRRVETGGGRSLSEILRDLESGVSCGK